MPSYLDMATPGGNMTPRWWLSPNYEALHRDAGGFGVGAARGGCEMPDRRRHVRRRRPADATAQASPLAQKWADNMTAKYEELATKEPIFAELRNCIDLAVVAALILKENLHGAVPAANCRRYWARSVSPWPSTTCPSRWTRRPPP